MFTRSLATLSELGLWILALLFLSTGCTSEVASKSASDGLTAPSTTLEESNMPDVPLIPRNVLFGNPERAQARISPDGRWLSFLAPVDGVLNVWAGPVGDPANARPVTDDTDQGIRNHQWAFDGQHILYSQDKDGNENWHIYATDIETKKTKDLTPIEGVHAVFRRSANDIPMKSWSV